MGSLDRERFTLTPNGELVERGTMRKLVLGLTAIAALTGGAYAQHTPLDQLHDKVILVFTPHPDDEVLGQAERLRFSTSTTTK